MKKLFLSLAAVAMLLPGCKKINAELDALGARLDKLEQESIPTIDEQISAINTTLDNLDAMDKELKGYIDGLTATAISLQEQINSTHTKIGEVKAALQGEISAAKADVLAQLEALETELKNELAQINATIETLKAKDEELDKKIADLKTYVDTELKNTKDWATATFSTLEQYNALCTEIATIKTQIENLNKSIFELETRLNTKIATDIATAVKGLQGELAKAVTEITNAYTSAISTAKEEITAAYTSAIQNAINALDVSLKAWVGEQLANYYTITEVDAMLATLKTDLESQLAAQKTYLEGLISSLSTTTAAKVAENKQLIDALRADLTEAQADIATNSEKISENATQIIANAKAIAENSENIEANEKLISDNKALIKENTSLIADNKSAIATLGTNVNKNTTAIAENATKIAQNADLIAQNATAITNNAAAIANNATEIANLKAQLETTAAEITEAYKKAIDDAVNSNNGVIDGKIANKVATINNRIDNEVAAINATIKVLTARVVTLESEVNSIKQQIAEILGDITGMKESITKLLARIQSVSYIPKYSDGKATVLYSDRASQVTLDFEISPKDAVVELANIWESALNVKAVYTETRAVPFVEMPVKKFEIDAANGIITVIASGENLSEPFFTGVQEASVRLAISDGNSSVVSEYIPMIAKYDETIINEDAIIDGVLYIATAQGLTKLKDTSIVSAELIATIDMAGESWTPIVNFAGVFDGNINKGYEIKNLSAPLFNKVTGTVQNLKLTTNITSTQEHIGAIARTLSGTIENCEIYGKIELDLLPLSINLNIGGVVGGCSLGGTMSNVTNYCTISVSSTCDIKKTLNIGGVAGLITSNGFDNSCNCFNQGKIFFNAITSLYANIGGVVGRTTKPLSGCLVNIGDIVIKNDNSMQVMVGGVVGQTTAMIGNAISYCDIQAIGVEKIGMITGAARSTSVIASNCQLGGRIATTESEKKTWDDDTEDYIVGISPDWIELNDTNYLTYIYGGTTDWTGVENYDGCSWLSVKPTLE